MIRKVLTLLLYSVLGVVLVAAAWLVWLRWESHQPRDEWFDQRSGVIVNAVTNDTTDRDGQLSAFVTLTSSTDLSVSFRVIRDDSDALLPVLLVLGGHRTGSDAVDLFGDIGERAIVAVDYPYHGPERVRGIGPILKTIPLARQAFLDTVPAVSLVLDWLLDQPWVDDNQLTVVGASLGVPFASTAAARDERITGAVLVHGAADNRQWLETQVSRRVETKLLHWPLGTLLHWLAYGPSLNTAERVADISPRPVLIVGARQDERTREGQTEALFAAAKEPKKLRWTEGMHVGTDRSEVIGELLRIADEELPFVGARPARDLR